MKHGYKNGLIGIEYNTEISDEHLFIDIKGVNHWTDIFICLLAWPRKGPFEEKASPWYHPGWYRAALNIYNNIKPLVKSDKIHFIMISGHSMGGAIGVILGQIIHRQTTKHVHIETVNSPKAGNKACNSYDSGYYSQVNYYDAGDIIRFLPFFYPKYRYRTCFADTLGVGKAHNNFPKDWKDGIPHE